MTYEEFRVALRKTDRKWEVRADGSIRWHEDGGAYFCPLEAVLGYSDVSSRIRELGQYLRLEDDLAFLIAAGADFTNEIRKGSLQVREDLLSDCGLSQ